MARAIWKGIIRFGGVAVPVKLYAAVEDRSVHFRLLHASDGVPLQQRMVHPETGKPVPPDEIRKGYALEDGVFVLLDDEELAALEPEASRDIEIVRFVDAGAIARPWYDRPYYLGPDGDETAYFALTEALHRKGREGVARWTMRKKSYRGALWSSGRYLTLVTLRAAGEVVPASALPAPGGRALDPKELAMAEQLVSALAGAFEPGEYRDEHRARVMELIEARARGRTITFRPARRKPVPKSLARALEESVARARRERERRAA